MGDFGLFSYGKKTPETVNYPKVLIYNNVLTEGSLQDPDLVLSGEDLPFIEEPVAIQLTGDYTGNDLYVANESYYYGECTVAIWRDYRSLVETKASGSPAPDVLLDESTSGICHPFEILNVNNRLYVSNTYGDCSGLNVNKQFQDGYVLVFDNAGAIVPGGGDTPTIEFYVPYARGMAVVNDTLYVTGEALLGKDGNPDTGAIFVFDNIPQRIADYTALKNGSPTTPSAVLYGDSFLNIDHVQPWRVDVFDNRLYVTTRGGALFVFDNADNLQESQAPSAVIGTTTGTVGQQGDMKMVGNTLYVGSAWDSKGKALFEDGIGLCAFRPGKNIQTGQNASLTFDSTNAQIGRCGGLANEGEVLFVSSGGSSFPSPLSYYGDVHIFYNADTLLAPKPANLVLPSLKDFVNPLSIDTNDFYFSDPAK